MLNNKLTLPFTQQIKHNMVQPNIHKLYTQVCLTLKI